MHTIDEICEQVDAIINDPDHELTLVESHLVRLLEDALRHIEVYLGMAYELASFALGKEPASASEPSDAEIDDYINRREYEHVTSIDYGNDDDSVPPDLDESYQTDIAADLVAITESTTGYMRPCETCRGSGSVVGDFGYLVLCETCDGSGIHTPNESES